jgi:hypothetical protein
MKERITQALLAAVVVLLVLHLFRGAALSPVQAGVDQTPDVLRGRSLEIVDDRGRVRASIKLHPANPKVTMPNGKTQQETVILRLIDQNGRPSVKLACSIDGAALMVAGESDPSYARIMSDLGTSTVTLVNKDGRQKLITP